MTIPTPHTSSARWPRLAALALLAAGPGLAQGLQPMTGQAPPVRPAPAPPPPMATELSGPPADAVRLPSGLAYKVLKTAPAGELPPADKDVIAIYVIGRSPTGEVFQDSFAQGKPQRMQVRHAFPAWREAMKTMVAGEARRWWFPADSVPPNPKTARREPAIFDVEIVSVGRIPDPPRFVSVPDPKAKRLPSGVAVQSLAAGKGERKLGRADGAMVSFTFWKSDGQAVNSSIAEGRPTLFPMGKVMPAFADCLDGMKPGEKRHCWIPAERNEGFPNAPSGALVFEVDLLEILDFEQALAGKIPAKPGSSS